MSTIQITKQYNFTPEPSSQLGQNNILVTKCEVNFNHAMTSTFALSILIRN